MLTALAVLLAAIEVFLDFTTWIQLNVAIVYGLPLVLAAASRSRRLVWGMAAALSIPFRGKGPIFADVKAFLSETL